MYVFASDVHLSDPSSDRYKVFLRWLKSLESDSQVKKVFLMGDVFDLWLGDRQFFISKHKEVLDVIFKIAKDKEVHIFEGNHDFQMGSFWSNNGVRVHKSFYEFSDQAGKWLLTHGDLLDPKDRNYLLLRKFFRSWFCRFLIKILPGFLLYKIGESINTTDKKRPGSKLKDFELKWSKWTESLRKERDFDFFICGHYHYRTDLKKDNYRALNLGSWLGPELKILSFSEGGFYFLQVS